MAVPRPLEGRSPLRRQRGRARRSAHEGFSMGSRISIYWGCMTRVLRRTGNPCRSRFRSAGRPCRACRAGARRARRPIGSPPAGRVPRPARAAGRATGRGCGSRQGSAAARIRAWSAGPARPTRARTRRRNRSRGAPLVSERLRRTSRHLRGPPQHGAHAGDQLAQTERLRDVVVGAQLEPGDAVDSPVLAVTMMIGIAALAARPRSRRQTSSPSMNGRFRSSSTRLGGSSMTDFSAAAPVLTISTSISPPRSRACFIKPGDIRFVFDNQTRGSLPGFVIHTDIKTACYPAIAEL